MVIVPLHKKAAAETTKQFMVSVGKYLVFSILYQSVVQLRTPKKYYIALVWGEVKHDKLDIRVDIGPETAGEWAGVRMATVDSETCDLAKVKTARTRLMVLERGLFRQMPATKVLLAPITGRRHQVTRDTQKLSRDIVIDHLCFSFEFTVTTSDTQ